MKILFLAIVASLTLAGSAYAYVCRTNCTTDYNGNQHCETRCTDY